MLRKTQITGAANIHEMDGPKYLHLVHKEYSNSSLSHVAIIVISMCSSYTLHCYLLIKVVLNTTKVHSSALVGMMS